MHENLVEVEDGLREKLKFAGITFLILLVPSVFLFKYAYSDYLNNQALYMVNSPHTGMTDTEAKEKAIAYLEKAKLYRKKHYVYYFNQARIYLELMDFSGAEKSFHELLQVKPDYEKGFLFYGIALELNQKPDSAMVYYEKYRTQVDQKFKDTDPDVRNTEHYKSYRLMLDLLLRDEDAYAADLQFLESEFPSFKLDAGINELKKADRSAFLLQYLGI